jgi:hypothetical protein
MKTRVVSRAYYEDAYLDFFILYYLLIGFDEIVILKADYDINKKNNTVYELPDFLDDEWKEKVKIKPVENLGNDILLENYEVFKDDSVDWVLNVDIDEFLILDWEKYSGGINDYLKKYLNELKCNKLVDDIEHVQQIKYRWMCITKMDNKLQDKNNIFDYVNNYPLECYKYIKSFGSTKHMPDKTNKQINCHFFINNNISKDIENSYNISRNENIYKKNHIYILDNNYCSVNNSDPKTLCKDGNACTYGYILHINTRSLTNAVTKCLVTKLRDNKKITNLTKFSEFINNINTDDINKFIKDTKKYSNDIEYHKKKFNYFLNSKYIFPLKINKGHLSVVNFLNMNKLNDLLINKCLHSKLLNNGKHHIKDIVFCNLNVENDIFKTLCHEKNIDYDKCMLLMQLY